MPIKIRYTSEEKPLVLLSGNIEKRMKAERVTDAQMAAATGMAERTFRGKKKHPETFTCMELRGVFRKLKFPEDEIIEAFR